MGSLHWADHLVVASLLFISLAIGVYYAISGGRQRTTSEFLVANRQLKTIPTTISLVMSMMSAIMVLGLSGEVYMYGTSFLVWGATGIILGIVISQQLFVAWLHPLQLTSAFEYLEKRFKSRAARLTASFLSVLSGILYMGVAMFAPSLALEAVTDIPVEVSVPVMALIATAYTSLGGMKAVVWTDVVQGCVMTIGLIIIMIMGFVLVGPSESYHTSRQAGRITFAEWSPDPRVRHSTWSLLVGMATNFMFLYGVNQASVQRYSAMATMRQARIVMLLACPTTAVLQAIVGATTIAVYGYFATMGCDPLESGRISRPDQIIPYFVQDAFGNFKGIIGLLLAILYSGALSSVSSSLSGCAANTWEDFLKPTMQSRLSEFQASILNKVLVLCTGILSMSVALLCKVLPASLIQITMAFFGVCGGPMLGVFLLGGIFRKAHWRGAVVGTWTAFVAVMGLLLGSQMMNVNSINVPLPPAPVDGCSNTSYVNVTLAYPGNETAVEAELDEKTWISNVLMISYMWYPLLSVIITLAVGMAVSYLTRYRTPSLAEEQVDDAYLIDWGMVFSLQLDTYNKAGQQIRKKTVNAAKEEELVKLRVNFKEAHIEEDVCLEREKIISEAHQ